jgi:hypothetical protein
MQRVRKRRISAFALRGGEPMRSDYHALNVRNFGFYISFATFFPSLRFPLRLIEKTRRIDRMPEHGAGKE